MHPYAPNYGDPSRGQRSPMDPSRGQRSPMDPSRMQRSPMDPFRMQRSPIDPSRMQRSPMDPAARVQPAPGVPPQQQTRRMYPPVRDDAIKRCVKAMLPPGTPPGVQPITDGAVKYLQTFAYFLLRDYAEGVANAALLRGRDASIELSDVEFVVNQKRGAEPMVSPDARHQERMALCREFQMKRQEQLDQQAQQARHGRVARSGSAGHT